MATALIYSNQFTHTMSCTPRIIRYDFSFSYDVKSGLRTSKQDTVCVYRIVGCSPLT
jgi:hypothetical protein